MSRYSPRPDQGTNISDMITVRESLAGPLQTDRSHHSRNSLPPSSPLSPCPHRLALQPLDLADPDGHFLCVGVDDGARPALLPLSPAPHVRHQRVFEGLEGGPVGLVDVGVGRLVVQGLAGGEQSSAAAAAAPGVLRRYLTTGRVSLIIDHGYDYWLP